MNEKSLGKMKKVYTGLWLVVTAAYAVWMTFFLKFDTYPLNESGMLKESYYFPWLIFSAVTMLMFIVYIRFFLYGNPGKGAKAFCLINLIFGCLFITWYGFFKDPLVYTASMIGLEFPWHFKMWGLFASLSIFTNVLYMYRKFDYHSKAGVICGSLGCAAIYVTINVPSAGEDLILNSLRCMSHWTGALLFAFLCAASIVIFLISRVKARDKRFTVAFAIFAAILLTMLVLLVTVGKNGVIESLPMWAAYLLLFLVNFTGVLGKGKSVEKSAAKETATV